MQDDSKIYFFCSEKCSKFIFYPHTQLIFDTLRELGEFVFISDEFRSVNPRPQDKLITYGKYEGYEDVVGRFALENRWRYVVDECNSRMQPYEQEIDIANSTGARKLLITYQNAAHLEKLRNNDITYVIMPLCMPNVRPKITKTHGILASGQFHETYYPVRTMLLNTIGNSPLQSLLSYLPYPGFEPPHNHNIHGENYYKLLDQFKMGIVCRALHRDRFLGKYVEMGACNVLPVGDCPTYMPDEMKKAMVNVEGMSKEDIVTELTRLFNSPDELEERTNTFTSEVGKRYLARPNMERVISEIKNHK